MAKTKKTDGDEQQPVDEPEQLHRRGQALPTKDGEIVRAAPRRPDSPAEESTAHRPGWQPS
jgi:hypothetical protein